ncbi:uncharacterized protein LOC144132436 isoform X3 [Amblyomma americanum]
MPFTKFVIKLVGCALKGIAKEGTPEEAVKALKGIGLILLNTLGLGDVLKKVSGAGMWCGSCKRVCKDPLHLNQGDTGLLAKCIDDAGVFCQKGALAEDTIYEELFETLKAACSDGTLPCRPTQRRDSSAESHRATRLTKDTSSGADLFSWTANLGPRASTFCISGGKRICSRLWTVPRDTERFSGRARRSCRS